MIGIVPSPRVPYAFEETGASSPLLSSQEVLRPLDLTSQYSRQSMAFLLVSSTAVESLRLWATEFESRIDARLSDLELQVNRLVNEKQVSSFTWLTELGVDDLRVVSPIPVMIDETDDEALARWPQAGVAGYGNTTVSALQNLKRSIADTYWDFVRRDQSDFGEIANQTMRELMAHILPGQ